jgi:hypothetical protein
MLPPWVVVWWAIRSPALATVVLVVAGIVGVGMLRVPPARHR